MVGGESNNAADQKKGGPSGPYDFPGCGRAAAGCRSIGNGLSPAVLTYGPREAETFRGPSS
jgi:hypothetical protein